MNPELESLSPESQEQAAEFIDALKEKRGSDEREIPDRVIPNDDSQTANGMARAIGEWSEEIDASGW